MRRQEHLRDKAMPKGSEQVGGRYEGWKRNRTLRVLQTYELDDASKLTHKVGWTLEPSPGWGVATQTNCFRVKTGLNTVSRRKVK